LGLIACKVKLIFRQTDGNARVVSFFGVAVT